MPVKTHDRAFDPFLRIILTRTDLDSCAFEIDTFLHDLYGGKVPAKRTDIDMLRVCIFDSVRRYGDKTRNLGGFFSNHPLQVAQALAAEGADPVTVAAGLYHDVPEEGISRLRKEYIHHAEACYRALHGSAVQPEEIVALRAAGRATFDQAEQNLIRGYLDELQKLLRRALRDRGVKDREGDVFLRNLLGTVSLVTRTHDQTYYQAIASITESGVFRRLLHSQQGIDRAIAVKFADRLTNSLDLSMDYRIRRRKNVHRSDVVRITERRLKAAFEGGSREAREKIVEEFRTNRDCHPERGERGYRGSEKLYQFYKAIVLVHISRTRRMKKAEMLRETAELKMVYRKGGLESRLLEVNLAELNDIIAHLITFHVPPRVAARTMQEFEHYERAGGLLRATKAGGPSKFDGIIETFFDTRLSGNKDALQELYRNKQGMLRAALGFRRVSELFMEDASFRFTGIGTGGLKTEAREAGTTSQQGAGPG